jgi:hypothetical protein
MYLDYIMHSDDMQVIRNHVHLVRSPRLDLDLMYNTRLDSHSRLCMCSRDRSRRT